ncbi:gamma-glutamyltransferase [Undibacterium seohonense]|uniref:Glutathione hydrolase proenzyme n=2 Tax=Undibacterium seohonense TaxID=1344950 RepID=A0ABR6X6E9_9BURK|nr:gamma-glutamyltransferase [Undibacterium seohonense]
MVVSQSDIASEVGFQVIKNGGNAMDSAIATAFALAVTHPTAGNIGGGGFLVYRSTSGAAVSYDFRESAPSGSSPEMWLKDGKYDYDLHHNSHRSVGVPGTVAGLYMAWQEQGSKPWKELVMPAVILARDGFEVSHGLARSLERVLPSFKKYPATLAQFSKNGQPYQAGETLKQADLARSLLRIAEQGPAGFYEGETALLIEQDMKANGGLITREDLKAYQAKKRDVIKGSYRGYDIIGMAPPSSGGVALVEMLNMLEGYDLKANGYGSAKNQHLITEAMRRAFADRAQHLGDPDFVSDMPITRLTSKDYAANLRKTINPAKASKSTPTSFTWPAESLETTHLSVVDAQRNAVSLTYTLEYPYGSRIVAPGTGFILNNEMGDFNAGPGLTTERGQIGTKPNLAVPGKRMLSSMAPTIISKDGQLFMVTGSPGGKTIINTVLTTILNVIDFGMNAQEAVDAGRMHHQWLPDTLTIERFGFSADTIKLLKAMGHNVVEGGNQGAAEVIILNAKENLLEGGVDRRPADGGAAGK